MGPNLINMSGNKTTYKQKFTCSTHFNSQLKWISLPGLRIGRDNIKVGSNKCNSTCLHYIFAYYINFAQGDLPVVSSDAYSIMRFPLPSINAT